MAGALTPLEICSCCERSSDQTTAHNCLGGVAASEGRKVVVDGGYYPASGYERTRIKLFGVTPAWDGSATPSGSDTVSLTQSVVTTWHAVSHCMYHISRS
jgi:hypothetical protein